MAQKVGEVIDAGGGGHKARRGAESALVEEDAVGGVEVALGRAVAGEVERREGKNGQHDEVALEADLDNGEAPEVADAGICGKGGVGFGSEVVKEFEFKIGEVILFGFGRGVGNGQPGAGCCGFWRSRASAY